MELERKRLRCAIYTRVSSEERLEQAFNSLAAQREACVAFIHSQRHEGWQVLETHYDDGGYSGGTLDRENPVPGSNARGYKSWGGWWLRIWLSIHAGQTVILIASLD